MANEAVNPLLDIRFEGLSDFYLGLAWQTIQTKPLRKGIEKPEHHAR